MLDGTFRTVVAIILFAALTMITGGLPIVIIVVGFFGWLLYHAVIDD